jgi:hypothetical protein
MGNLSLRDIIQIIGGASMPTSPLGQMATSELKLLAGKGNTPYGQMGINQLALGQMPDTLYEEGNLSPYAVMDSRDQYINYLNSIVNNPRMPRESTDNQIGRLRAAEELQRLKGLL